MERRTLAPPRTQRPPGAGRRLAPGEDTHAEAAWYLKQMQARTPVVVVLRDGEELRGVIEWYDRACIKVNRLREPNLLVFKHAIKYVLKDPAAPGGRR